MTVDRSDAQAHDQLESRSLWLTVERVMERYGYPRSTVYKLAAVVRTSKPPLLGLHLFAPSIDAYIEAAASNDPARDVQSESAEPRSDDREE